MKAKEESEELMNSILKIAQKLLTKQPTFYPLGAFMEPDCQIRHVAVEDPDTDYPDSNVIIETLKDMFSEMASSGKAKATAIAVDVRTIPPGTDTKTDAIQIRLDHRDGYSVEVFFPYQRSDNGSIVYGDTFAATGRFEFFGKKDSIN